MTAIDYAKKFAAAAFQTNILDAVAFDADNIPVDTSYMVPANQLPLPYIDRLPGTVESYYGTAAAQNYMPILKNNQTIEHYNNIDNANLYPLLIIIVVVIILVIAVSKKIEK